MASLKKNENLLASPEEVRSLEFFSYLVSSRRHFLASNSESPGYSQFRETLLVRGHCQPPALLCYSLA